MFNHFVRLCTILIMTRNTFCGTWYLPLCWIHYDRHRHLVFMSQLLAYLQQTRLLFTIAFTIHLYSPSCSSTPISYMMRKFRRFCHKLRLYCIFFNAHVRTWLTSTSGLKSDVTVVFLDPDFLCDAGISVSCEHSRQKLAYLCLHGFSGPFGPKWRFRGGIKGKG